MGFIGFYWVLLGSTGFYWVLLDFTGLSGFYWVLPGFTGFYRVPLVLEILFPDFNQVLLCSLGSTWFD